MTYWDFWGLTHGTLKALFGTICANFLQAHTSQQPPNHSFTVPLRPSRTMYSKWDFLSYNVCICLFKVVTIATEYVQLERGNTKFCYCKNSTCSLFWDVVWVGRWSSMYLMSWAEETLQQYFSFSGIEFEWGRNHTNQPCYFVMSCLQRCFSIGFVLLV